MDADLEAIRSAKRKLWLYGVLYGNELYLKIYRVLSAAEKRLRGGGNG